MNAIKLTVMLLGLLLFSINSFAHGGRTNASGCHTRHSDGMLSFSQLRKQPFILAQ